MNNLFLLAGLLKQLVVNWQNILNAKMEYTLENLRQIHKSNDKSFIFRLSFFLGLTLALTGCGNLTTAVNAQTILINISQSYPGLWRLATGGAYVLGFMMAFKAIYSLKVYGEARTMMSSQGNLKAPIIYLLVSAALIYMPAMYHSLLLTTFGTASTSPIDYASSASGLSPAAMKAFYGLIQVSGLFAFIRGWIIISRSAEQGAQQNMFGKGLTHVLGGLLAINIIGTKDIIFSTLGLR